LRIGIGYDVHSLQTGRKLVLGGVHIPFDRGLLGHSDADVLLHAICDALLGAAALGDIGQHFPNTDPAYKNIESLLLLNQVNLRLAEAGYRVKNIDSTIIAQEPRLSPYLEAMKNNIASQLGISPNRSMV
jgi:2-C-methyl-D-erythritol 2,4-cyclodiphosphate synthase